MRIAISTLCCEYVCYHYKVLIQTKNTIERPFFYLVPVPITSISVNARSSPIVVSEMSHLIYNWATLKPRLFWLPSPLRQGKKRKKDNTYQRYPEWWKVIDCFGYSHVTTDLYRRRSINNLEISSTRNVS